MYICCMYLRSCLLFWLMGHCKVFCDVRLLPGSASYMCVSVSETMHELKQAKRRGTGPGCQQAST